MAVAAERCFGLRQEHVAVGARALCLSGQPHGEHETPRASDPRVYAVRQAVALAVSDLIQSGRVPGLTDEEVIAGMVAEAMRRVDLLNEDQPTPPVAMNVCADVDPTGRWHGRDF